jgi:hypothetical protein
MKSGLEFVHEDKLTVLNYFAPLESMLFVFPVALMHFVDEGHHQIKITCFADSLDQ